MTSRFEGFPITFTEALYFGNYILTSPVSSAAHITAQGKYGKVVNEDALEFAAAIEQSIADSFLNQQKYEEIQAFAKDNFTWTRLIKKLAENLKI